MGNLSEKAAYLRGLADGYELGDSSSKESKMLLKVVEFLEDVADEFEEIEVGYDELSAAVDEIDSDVSDLNDFVFDLDDDNEDYDFDDLDYEEIECPHCNEVIELEDIMLNQDEERVICPNCHNEIKLELCDCDCGNHDADDGEE